LSQRSSLVDSLSQAPTSSCDHGNHNGNGNDF
jgi:hypothetical protein